MSEQVAAFLVPPPHADVVVIAFERQRQLALLTDLFLKPGRGVVPFVIIPLRLEVFGQRAASRDNYLVSCHLIHWWSPPIPPGCISLTWFTLPRGRCRAAVLLQGRAGWARVRAWGVAGWRRAGLPTPATPGLRPASRGLPRGSRRSGGPGVLPGTPAAVHPARPATPALPAARPGSWGRRLPRACNSCAGSGAGSPRRPGRPGRCSPASSCA